MTSPRVVSAAIGAWAMLGLAIMAVGVDVGRVWIVGPAIVWAIVLLALIARDPEP